jgi:putative endonuclease
MRHGVGAVYVVTCADGSLYTGFAKDVVARVAVHNAGRGARATKGRLPVRLRWAWECRSAEDAHRLEALIKQLHRLRKVAMIRGDARVLLPLLAEVARRRRTPTPIEGADVSREL